MMPWTERDEALLQDLQARKYQVEYERQEAVIDVVEGFYRHDMLAREVAKALIEHADEVIDALQPYRSKK